MATANTSTSIPIYDVLTRIIPGFVFLLFLSGLATFLAGEIPNFNSESIWILALVFSFLFGEGINSARLAFYDVPEHFRRVLYAQNNDLSYLSPFDQKFARLDQKLTNRFDWWEESIERECVFDLRGENIIDLISNRYNIPREDLGSYDTYNLIISDLSGSETRRTSRLRSVYILTKNLRISLMFGLMASLGFGVISVIRSGIGLNLGILISLLMFFLTIMFIYMIETFARGIISIDGVYVESLLKDYATYINETDNLK